MTAATNFIYISVCSQEISRGFFVFFSMDGSDSRFINLVVEELRHKTHLLLATSACS